MHMNTLVIANLVTPIVNVKIQDTPVTSYILVIAHQVTPIVNAKIQDTPVK